LNLPYVMIVMIKCSVAQIRWKSTDLNLINTLHILPANALCNDDRGAAFVNLLGHSIVERSFRYSISFESFTDGSEELMQALVDICILLTGLFLVVQAKLSWVHASGQWGSHVLKL